jgi:hypothetical protein
MNYTDDDSKWLTNPEVLLHAGNLDFIFKKLINFILIFRGKEFEETGD